ncbi:MAG: carbohydrate kinase family protein [Acidobacteriaceae bacterium]
MTSLEKRFDVSIAGEINLDLILYGLSENIPLEREILATDFQCTLGGSSSIVAHNLASLGATVGFSTRLGKDELGRIALERMAASGADLSEVVYAEDATNTGVTVLLHHGAKRRILTYPGTMSGMTRADLNFEYLASAKHFHLSSLFLQQALAPDLPALFRDLKHAGLTISLDTNDDPDNVWDGVLHELLEYVDLLLPNAEEACRIARRDTVEEALGALSGQVPCIAAKCGPAGALLQIGDNLSRIPPIQVTPVDTIGAGDSFDAGFLYGYVRGADPLECAFAGNITGALSTLRPGGTEAFRDAELRESFLRKHNFPFANRQQECSRRSELPQL